MYAALADRARLPTPPKRHIPMKHETGILAVDEHSKSPAELALAVRCLPPGAGFVYHSGFLTIDAEKSAEAAEIRKKAWQQYEDDKVILLQKRHGPSWYDYVAVIRGRA